jgi:glutathione peroxidase
MRHFLSLIVTFLLLAAPARAETAHAFAFQSIDGAPMPLDRWRGKVLLIANTASFCGYTHQYEGLQKLWERYEGRGLVVIGVPSNDFGGQEPKAESEIAEFCKGAFNVTFPLTSKLTVTGAAPHPFYRWARAALGAPAAPRWNFHKYLVGRDGKLIAGFGSATAPLSSKLVEAIEKALAASS